MPSRFHELEVRAKLKEKRRLSAFLDELVRKNLKKTQKVQLTYIFCSDEHLLGINQQFLKHNTYTDIITFDLGEYDDEMIGEIYVSVDRVADNAEKFGVSYNDELHRVIFHGALHLCGYKDKTDADRKEMRRKEDLCLKQYFKA
ncbi:rRNA maturation RNase YbeY [Polluticoccus soli]|uniref:rRNA maturation RNase YbeY n=1 Tax=Polluticoccus soli TaxID=3034150 RepID=UPI0023E23589|nr:rRNA maturation RNase YbeY [Flavipsychrobacter sp. JY13-12]